MNDFVFDDFARTTLGGARNSANGAPLTEAQIQRVIDYLSSPGSGPDGTSSYADYLSRQLRAHPAKLPDGVDYVAFSGSSVDVNGNKVGNFDVAADYVRHLDNRAGIIGDTPWGRFIEETSGDPSFKIIEQKLQTFMQAEGIEPFGRNYRGALQDMMWNAGSPEFLENAIESRRPIVAFVENAPPGRGFSNFELTTALNHPDAVINGYPVSAFGDDPLAFASKSAAEFQQLERGLVQAATANSGRPVSLEELRATVRVAEGYDAVAKTVFGESLDSFRAMSLDEMTTARSGWLAARGGTPLGPRITLDVDAPERVPGGAPEPVGPRAAGAVPEPPPSVGVRPADALPDGVPPDLSPTAQRLLKGAGAAGVALLAYDFATTGHRVVELRAQGNDLGAESAATHFIGRNVGGIAGGFLAGAGYGVLMGWETGPGVILTSLGGGVVGAYLGEKWAEQRDLDSIYTQKDARGIEWTRDPADPKANWTRVADTQQVQVVAAGGGEVSVAPRTDRDGDAQYRDVRYVAGGDLARQLDYAAANASYALGLAHPPAPQNPHLIPGAQDREGWRAGPWRREDDSGAWERTYVMAVPAMGAGMGMGMSLPPMEERRATAEETAMLDAQSQVIVAQNAANTPAAVAARYRIAYEQFGWEKAGLVPDFIVDAERSVGTLRASDGRTYTRGGDGEWTYDGWLRDPKAEGNVRAELDATFASQRTGLADMAAIAQYAREHPLPQPDVIREMVAGLYRDAGVARSDAELDAAVTAVRRDHTQDGLNGSFSLKLLPDPATGAPGPNSAIATYSDDGRERMAVTSVTTPLEMRTPATPAETAPPGTAPAAPEGDGSDPDRRRGALETPDPLRENRYGMTLDRFFDAAARGDGAEYARVAAEHAGTVAFRALDAVGRDGLQQLAAAERAQQARAQEELARQASASPAPSRSV